MRKSTTFFLLFYQAFLFGQFTENYFAAVNREATILAIGDVDGDGDNDVLAGFNISDDIPFGWFENFTGNGDFGLLKPLGPNYGSFIDFVTATDLDGDGITDILIVDAYISWWPGTGNGIFGDRIDLANGSYVKHIFTVDLDLDGDTDLVYEANGEFIWLENDGTGDFAGEELLADGIANAKLAMVDLDNDGDADLLSAKPGDISWFQNNAGAFNSIHQISTAFASAYSMAAADLDNDGDVDFALMGNNVNGFVWFENVDGMGNFTSEHLVYDTIGGFSKMWIEDLDNDLDNDIILTMPNSYNLVWFENLANETYFGSPKLITDVTNISSQSWFGDLDGDGDVDNLTISGTNSAYTYWVPNVDGAGNFGERKNLLKRVASRHIAPADIDGDGDTDLMVASDGVIWLKNLDGLGDFSSPIDIEDDPTTNDPYEVFPEDMDGDGDLDLIAAWQAGGHRWYENLDGKGNFGPPKFINVKSSSYTFLEDVDGDGDKDLLSIHGQTHEISWTERQANGFGPVHLISTDVGTYADALFEDFDNDGDKDLILVQTWLENALYWYKNNNGVFSTRLLIDDPDDEYRRLRVADIDEDGWNDLIYNKWVGGNTLNFVWRKNLDGNGFGPEEMIQEEAGNFRDILVDDVNGNGYKDIVTVTQTPDEVNLYLNDGGVLGPKQAISTKTFWHKTVTSANINNNGGDKDLVMSTILEAAIVWYDNLFESFIIEGLTFWDENENQIKDATELPLIAQQVFLEPQSVYSWSNGNGQYTYSITPGDYQLSILPDNHWQATGSTVVDISIGGANGYAMHNFGLSALADVNEVGIDVTAGLIRCSEPVPFWLNCKNIGTTIAKGTFVVELGNLVNFESSDPMPDEIQGNILTWHFADLVPTYSEVFQLVLNMPDATHIGDTIDMLTKVFLEDDSGVIVFEDEFNYQSELRCSYDPNDKLVDKALIDFEKYELNGANLFYTIRFQNTGNDVAFHVLLEDVLDPKLNWSTLQVVNSSHPHQVYLEDGGLLSFYFENIMLPDSNTNSIASQGFVKFKISLQDNLPDMSLIENGANIYFDSNPPVLTNTTTTILETIPLEKGDTMQYAGFDIWPNPAKGTVYLIVPDPISEDWQITISSIAGKIIQTIDPADLTPGKNKLELHQLKETMYILSIKTDSKKFSRKLILLHDD
ncbi:MAG: T9SS type A sorting domain-containing protein [Saprospiraceae bacterium]